MVDESKVCPLRLIAMMFDKERRKDSFLCLKKDCQWWVEVPFIPDNPPRGKCAIHWLGSKF